MLEILYKSKNYVAISKPYGMPSEQDPTGSPDAMTECSRELSLMGENDKLWLVHRLDRVVGGAMIFARNRNSASEISRLISENALVKEYIAVVEGTPTEGELVDYLYKDARLGRAVISEKGKRDAKEARLTLKVLDTYQSGASSSSLVYITLRTGRFHQIRAQLSSRGNPIIGDGKYGSRDNKCKCIALFSHHLKIDLKSEKIEVYKMPERDSYPWNLFNIDERLDAK